MTKTSQKTLSPKVKRIVNIFQFLYVLIAILIPLLILFELSLGKMNYEALLPMVIVWAIAYGIVKRKSWVVMLITLVAAIGIFNDLLRPESLYEKIFFIVFFLFEIFFFNRKDIRTYFGAKGIALF
jgi:hypothetical protein